MIGREVEKLLEKALRFQPETLTEEVRFPFGGMK
jgi:hypothetical protein